jgi:phosphatidylserine synthase
MLEQPLVRFAVPQLLTATRLVLGTVALISAMDGRTYMAATMITSGAVTDGLDGFVARRLDATSPFGALFDYFADYVCYVVAPWAVAASRHVTFGALARVQRPSA